MYWDIVEMLQQNQDTDSWGKKTLQRLSVDLKNDYSEIKGFTVRNMQYMVQFFNEYNKDLTMVKDYRPISQSAITKSLISQLDEYNFTLPVKHLDWTHNLVLMKQVKDIRARYWYMVQSITNHWTTRYLQEAIKNWIRNRYIIEFWGTWEVIHNPNFKVVKFDHFKMNAGLPSFVLSASEWIDRT